MAGGPKRVQSEPRGFSVPGATGLTEEEAREALEDAERRTQEAMEKIEKLRPQVEAIGAVDVDVSVNKLEPVRYVSAFIVLLTALLNTLNLMGWTSFTVVEQTAIIGGATAIANEVARMHVTAPPKS